VGACQADTPIISKYFYFEMLEVIFTLSTMNGKELSKSIPIFSKTYSLSVENFIVI